MKNKNRLFLVILIVAGFLLNNCFGLFDSDSSSSSNSGSSSDGDITVTPSTVTLARGETQQFTVDQSYGITWSLEGATGNSNISNGGLLTVGTDETSGTLTVRAKKSYYNDGTARVTIAAPSATPQGLKVLKPGPNSVELSWQPLSGTGQYTVSRSVNGTTFGQIGTTSTTSYIDTAVSANSSYYYRISANGANSNVIFVFAADYFNMLTFAQRKLIPLNASVKHYYRFAVTAGNEYTVEWQNGNNQNYGRWDELRVSAWQNNGTSIFSGAYDGYTSPRVFTATATGFVTVEVSNNHSSARYDYQIYCYGIDGTADTGTVALPPYKVSAFRVSSTSSNSITLTWDSVSDTAKYNIYRANTQTGTSGKMGESYGTSFTDNQVPPGGSFWYTIAAVNADGREGCTFQGTFGIAASHYTLSIYSGAQTLVLAAEAKHYYRLAVTQGNSYTIEWQNGSNQNYGRWDELRVSAWQNNGTSIFSGAYDGYTSPRVFTATATGFVTVEVSNNHSSASYNYQVYYY
jgi:fibronectin type 3 domain-containing protein